MSKNKFYSQEWPQRHRPYDRAAQRETKALANNMFWHSKWPWVFVFVAWGFFVLIIYALDMDA